MALSSLSFPYPVPPRRAGRRHRTIADGRNALLGGSTAARGGAHSGLHSEHRCTKGPPVMIDLYYWTTPNGHKITIFLEETGLSYKIIPINIGKGEQFKPEFLAVSPNNRIPGIVDHSPADNGKPISVFESGAILLY